MHNRYPKTPKYIYKPKSFLLFLLLFYYQFCTCSLEYETVVCVPGKLKYSCECAIFFEEETEYAFWFLVYVFKLDSRRDLTTCKCVLSLDLILQTHLVNHFAPNYSKATQCCELDSLLQYNIDASFGVLRKTISLVNLYNFMKYKTLKVYFWLSTEQI